MSAELKVFSQYHSQRECHPLKVKTDIIEFAPLSISPFDKISLFRIATSPDFFGDSTHPTPCFLTKIRGL